MDDKKISCVIAVDKHGGIGYQGTLPWFCKEELKLFRKITLGNNIVVGNNTARNLPQLTNRKIHVLSRDTSIKDQSSSFGSKFNYVSSIEQLLSDESVYPLFVCGGSQVYKLFFDKNLVDIVYLSIMNKNSENVDTYIDFSMFRCFTIKNKTEYEEFTHYELVKEQNMFDEEYIRVLKNVYTNGKLKAGRNGDVISLFSESMKFDLSDGYFPLLTTKKMYMKGIVEELLFFIRGDTDTKKLERLGINIWTGNTNKDFLKLTGLNYEPGDMGPMYGYQWRNFNKKYNSCSSNETSESNNGFDQIKNVIENIKRDPSSRRHLITTLNPLQTNQGVLWPCHSIVCHFNAEDEDDFLDMICYNRSQDMFLGNPWNIASSALFLCIMSKLTGRRPRMLTIFIGDAHIYKSHVLQVEEQIKRIPYSKPRITIPDIKDLEDVYRLTHEDFIIEDYTAHPSIKAEMVS